MQIATRLSATIHWFTPICSTSSFNTYWSLPEKETEDAGDAAYHLLQFLLQNLEIQHEKTKERRKCYLKIIKTLIKAASITLLYIAKYYKLIFIFFLAILEK